MEEVRGSSPLSSTLVRGVELLEMGLRLSLRLPMHVTNAD
jgi:hypothetical protein